MKKSIIAALVALGLVSCAKNPVEILLPKATMEFAGNGFDSFSLGADVRVYMAADQDNPKQWNILAAVPVRKETDAIITALDMELSLLDEKGIRVRDSFSLVAELFPYKQAKAMLEAAKGGRLSINAETYKEELKPEDVPYTVPWLCKKTGVNGLLSQYRAAVRKKDLRKAGDIEAKIYKIEKDVKNNDYYPENLRKKFIAYVENKIEDIDDGK